MAIAVQTKKFDVGGVMLERPFKLRRLGHFGYNTSKLDECLPDEWKKRTAPEVHAAPPP